MKVTDDAPVLPHWLNGHALLAVAGSYHDICDAQGQILRRTPLPDGSYLQQAQAAAAAAQAAWLSQDAAARQAVLTAVAEQLERYQEHLAKLLQEETPLQAAAALAELQAAASQLRQPVGGTQAAVLTLDAAQADATQPLSAVLAQAAPALAAGSAVAILSDCRRPSTLLAVAELFSRAGLPAGVFNVAHGNASAAALLAS